MWRGTNLAHVHTPRLRGSRSGRAKDPAEAVDGGARTAVAKMRRPPHHASSRGPRYDLYSFVSPLAAEHRPSCRSPSPLLHGPTLAPALHCPRPPLLEWPPSRPLPFLLVGGDWHGATDWVPYQASSKIVAVAATVLAHVLPLLIPPRPGRHHPTTHYCWKTRRAVVDVPPAAALLGKPRDDSKSPASR
jgi:hypothetical protein